jgi:hypothetical protein
VNGTVGDEGQEAHRLKKPWRWRWIRFRDLYTTDHCLAEVFQAWKELECVPPTRTCSAFGCRGYHREALSKMWILFDDARSASMSDDAACEEERTAMK